MDFYGCEKCVFVYFILLKLNDLSIGPLFDTVCIQQNLLWTLSWPLDWLSFFSSFFNLFGAGSRTIGCYRHWMTTCLMTACWCPHFVSPNRFYCKAFTLSDGHQWETNPVHIANICIILEERKRERHMFSSFCQFIDFVVLSAACSWPWVSVLCVVTLSDCRNSRKAECDCVLVLVSQHSKTEMLILTCVFYNAQKQKM